MIKIQGNVNFQGKTILGTVTPTYAIGRSLSAVNEGSSVVFTLSTTNVANGTVLPYTISGISSTDVTTGSLTGSFTVSNNLATATITLSADRLTEGAETATLTLNNAAASNFVVVNDTSVDASAYIAAVEAADGQALEASIKTAYNNFIVGCKSDGIWNAIKASCILAGARTLNGSLVPLVGTAPTNNNFVSADYNRKTGLIGNGTTKFINTNRSNDADPRNSKHICVFMSQHSTRDANRYAISAGSGSTQCNLFTNTTQRIYRVNSGSNTGAITDSSTTAGFWGASRGASTSYLYRYAGATTSVTLISTGHPVGNHGVFSNVGTGGASFNGRLSFYSIGEYLNLAALDTRVSNLMTAINAAI
jgi:hypothetical protein